MIIFVITVGFFKQDEKNNLYCNSELTVFNYMSQFTQFTATKINQDHN